MNPRYIPAIVGLLEEGADVVTGGGVPDMPGDLAGGSWVQPTIWTGLPDTARTVREEIFGPCCHVAPFDTEDEVIARANNTDYGLAAAVWTENISRAHRVAGKLQAGVTWVNSWYLRDLRTPFGGMKQSGIGREGELVMVDARSDYVNLGDLGLFAALLDEDRRDLVDSLEMQGIVQNLEATVAELDSGNPEQRNLACAPGGDR